MSGKGGFMTFLCPVSISSKSGYVSNNLFHSQPNWQTKLFSVSSYFRVGGISSKRIIRACVNPLIVGTIPHSSVKDTFSGCSRQRPGETRAVSWGPSVRHAVPWEAAMLLATLLATELPKAPFYLTLGHILFPAP